MRLLRGLRTPTLEIYYKEKGFKGKGSTSKSMDDEAGDKKHLTVECPENIH